MGAPLSDEFPGTRRYTPTRLLGAGSWGRVYQAYDNERNAFVAVKLLSKVSPESLLRFKREFRSLQNVVHPNLVTLYELLSESDQWFFTMEYVEGKTFLDYVLGPEVALNRPPSASPIRNPLAASTQDLRSPELRETREAREHTLRAAAVIGAGGLPILPAPPPEHRRPPLSGGALVRLRHALGQLVDGLSALHAAGKLHRDVKPSNVLVTREGRVVLLDFGLVRELDESDAHQSQGLVVGTPAYMSPEQGVGLPVKESTDWYAVGVLLYEVLTGQVPFEGRPGEMMLRRRELPVPRPSDFTEGVPEDLEQLCLDLLSRRPESRPDGAELEKRLVRPRQPLMQRAVESTTQQLVGREGALEQLHGALAQVLKTNQPALCLIEAESGLGKSALLKGFLDEVARVSPDALVLHGRCGETETVPFKAFDAVVDELTAHLAAMTASQLDAVAPRELSALARLFPVLRRLDSTSLRRRVTAPESADPQELRRRGFRALSELLERLAERTPVVLAIDDLQWGDADSAALLEALLRPPDAAPLLVIGATRSARGEAGPAPVVKAFLDACHAVTVTDQGSVSRLSLWPLKDDDALALAQRLAPHASPERQQQLVKESGGSPWLLEALASVPPGPDGNPAPHANTLESFVRDRIEALPAPARRLLEVVAVANRPVERLLAWAAAGLDAEVADPLVPLKAARLLSSGGSGQHERLLLYDGRVGEVVRAQVPNERKRTLLLSLADALHSSGRADAETLAVWWSEAGETERAWKAAADAASQAAHVLAFDRAVRLYDQALRGAPAFEQRALKLLRADALAGAGHGREAADAYLALAKGAGSSGEDSQSRALAVPGTTAVKPPLTGQARRDALELQRKATEQLLYSGHIDEGIAVLDKVMASLGEKKPAFRTASLLRAGWARARIKLKGLDAQLLPPEKQDPELLARVDAYWAAAKGFSIIDPVRGTAYQFEHLLLALRCGEPYRVMRALALEAGFHALMGANHAAECKNALSRLRLLLADHPSAHGEGLAALMAGCEALGTGRFGESRALHERAVALFREKCPGMTWELTTSLQYLLQALIYSGDFAEVRSRLAEAREWARARNDLYALTNFRVRAAPVLALADDDPTAAQRDADEALSGFSRRGYFIQHFWGLQARTRAALYQAQSEIAGGYLEAEREPIEASGLLRIQFARVLMADLEAAVARARADGAGLSAALKRLDAEGLAWPQGLATMHRGAWAATEGQHAKARSLLASASAQLEAIGVRMVSACASRLQGEISADDEGKALVQDMDEWLSSRGIKRPARFARAWC